MKIKSFIKFTEGLSDLRRQMISSGHLKEWDPNHFSSSEKLDLYEAGYDIVDDSTFKLQSGELIKKSISKSGDLSYILEKDGKELFFIRISQLKTIPSDWERFKIALNNYLSQSNK